MTALDSANAGIITPIVLAAGRSRRMGTQKLLLPLHDRPIIRHVVETIAQSGLSPVHVVVGPDGSEIEKALTGLDTRKVLNPQPDDGMLSSVRCGLRSVPAGATAVLIALGDQPGLTPEVIRLMLAAFDGSETAILVPACNGRRGHPLLLGMGHREAILTQFDDEGLRGLLAQYPGAVQEVPTDTPGILEDIDVPEDYARAQKNHPPL